MDKHITMIWKLVCLWEYWRSRVFTSDLGFALGLVRAGRYADMYVHNLIQP